MVVGSASDQQKKTSSMLSQPWRPITSHRDTMSSSEVAHRNEGVLSSYRIAVDTEQLKIPGEFITPRILKQRNKCLSFRPVNTITRTASCCSKKMCFARSSSKSPNTSPHGSCHSSRFKSKTIVKSTRRSIIRSLSRKSKKGSSFKNQVTKDSKFIQDYNANASGCAPIQSSAVFVHNAYLRQTAVEMEVEIKQDAELPAHVEKEKKDCGYSAGFAPKITSTPVHKSWKTFDLKATSDYFSRPSSGEGSSGKPSEVNDNSETELLHRMETSKQTKYVENEEVTQEYDSAFCTICNQDVCAHYEGRLQKKHFFTSTPRKHKMTKPSRLSVKQKLPGLYPIGAPSAASSPIDQQRFQAIRPNNPALSVWRPWC